jgi:hypothetical protein
MLVIEVDVSDDVFTITVEAEPGGHRFRFIVDGESRTSPDYRLATDHQNVVVNYLDHMKSDDESDAGSYESYPEEYGITYSFQSDGRQFCCTASEGSMDARNSKIRNGTY